MNPEREVLQRFGARWQVERDILTPRLATLRMDLVIGREILALTVVLQDPFDEEMAIDAAAEEFHAHILAKLAPWVITGREARYRTLENHQRPTAVAPPRTVGTRPARKPTPNRRPTKRSGQRRG